MGRFTDAVKGMFRRRKPVTPQEAEELADWVNEGGAFDPAGPPEVIDHRHDSDGDGEAPKDTEG